MKAQSYPHNLQSVLFEAMPLSKKVLSIMIPQSSVFGFLEMSCCLNTYFFHTFPDSFSEITFSKISSFEYESLPPSVQFNPDKVYVRRQRTNATTFPPLQEPAPTPPTPDPPHPALRRSSRLTRPPNRYGFSHSSYLVALSSTSIPTSYSQAAK
eukprot:TRINITY_DN12904_c0_g1_i1.p1 TRINITY_DN12904_c0_g1~~TRINITY_DN12904_c0_g1_i1.p1  ORF type:complete len:154 (-),score=16.33 TRINITY_DN12904_c0_g1_i1:242-703(-)